MIVFRYRNMADMVHVPQVEEEDDPIEDEWTMEGTRRRIGKDLLEAVRDRDIGKFKRSLARDPSLLHHRYWCEDGLYDMEYHAHDYESRVHLYGVQGSNLDSLVHVLLRLGHSEFLQYIADEIEVFPFRLENQTEQTVRDINPVLFDRYFEYRILEADPHYFDSCFWEDGNPTEKNKRTRRLDDLIRKFPSQFHYASAFLLGKRQVVLSAIEFEPSLMRKVSVTLLEDPSFILESVQKNGRALRYAPRQYHSDFHVALQALRNNPYALFDNSFIGQEDLEIMTEMQTMIDHYGRLLAWASPTIDCPMDLLQEILRQDRLALQYVPSHLSCHLFEVESSEADSDSEEEEEED